MSPKFRSRDPARSAELQKEITKHGRVSGFEENGRQFLDPRPMAARPRVREQPSPLEAMYNEIRTKEAIARQAHESDTPQEAADFDIPDELEDLLSGYEEMLEPDLSVFGEAIKDPRVYDAVQAVLEDRYGPLEAGKLAEMAKEREDRSTPSPAPSKPVGGPGSTGEPPVVPEPDK